MSGRFMELLAGRYTLKVPNGHGPAGVHRQDGDVQVDHRGGSVSFDVPADERVYFWWRGPSEPAGVRIIGAKRPTARRPAAPRSGSRFRRANRVPGESGGPPERISA